jgi:hypothetical protein
VSDGSLIHATAVSIDGKAVLLRGPSVQENLTSPCV